MKAPLLFTLGFLAPSILASTNHATTSAPIFVLKTSQTATSVLSKALGKLGYIHQDARQGNYSTSSTTNTYVEVTSDAQLLEISTAHPEAKFIIPSGSRLFSASASGFGREDGASGSWWGRQRASGAELVSSEGGSGGIWFAQGFLSEKNENGNENFLDGVLELDVLALEKGAQAENWVRLCDFLGLGYSVVERLSLWHFPQ